MTTREPLRLVSRRGFLGVLALATSAGLGQACLPAPQTSGSTTQATSVAPTQLPGGAGAPPTPAGRAPVAAVAQAAPTVARAGGTLVAGWEAEPGAFENNIDRGAVTRTLLHMLYDRLVERDISVKADTPPFVPGLATSWDVSPDARTYTFHLRQGVKFHDGTPCDAEAVRFNVERNYKADHPFYDKSGAGSTALGYKNVDRVEVLDASTVRITHKDPFADFLYVIGFGTYSMASPTAVQQYGNADFPNHPVGTGPFKFVERQSGVKVVFERNADYWGGAPAIDGFIVRPLPEAVARVTALQTGEVDWINAVAPDSIGNLQANANFEVGLAQLPNTWGYIPNHRATPTNNVKLRQAMNYAVNREVLARDVMRGLAVPSTGPFAPGTPGYDPNLRGYTFDPAKAKQLLAEAGFPNGVELRFQIPQGGAGSPFGVQMTEYVQQNFRDVGINANIETLEFQTFQSNMANGIPPDVHAYNVGFSVDELVNLQRHYRSDLVPPNGNTNPGWIENPELDALLKQALGTVNDDERKNVYFDVEQKAVDLGAWVWVVHQKGARAWSKKVQGFANPNSYMFTFRTVSLG